MRGCCLAKRNVYGKLLPDDVGGSHYHTSDGAFHIRMMGDNNGHSDKCTWHVPIYTRYELLVSEVVGVDYQEDKTEDLGSVVSNP